MIEVHREIIEKAGEQVTIRIPKEMIGERVEVVLTASEGVDRDPVGASESAGNGRIAVTPHPSWTPEMLALLTEVAGSMPELEEINRAAATESGEERDWH